MKSKNQKILEVEAYLDRFIPKTNMKRFPAEVGILRTKELLRLLDNPQEKLKVVHIAGTSGKGSTALVMNSLLMAHGFKCGMHVKPHLLDIRERFQINNTNLEEDTFYSYFTVVRNAIEKMSGEYGQPTYFEVLISLAFYVFHMEKVDYAVIETGVGGLYDGSNVIENDKKVSLLTKIGYDHMAILGNTLEEIAYQKAMIMMPNTTAFSCEQEENVDNVFKEVAAKQQSQLTFVRPESYHISSIHPEGTAFDYTFGNFRFQKLQLHLAGDFQVENASLALAALIYLSSRDGFILKEAAIRSSLKDITYPGRFEVRKAGKKIIILDGAHNPQKMNAFLSNLKTMYPDKQYSFIVGFKYEKDIADMVTQIVPFANKVFSVGFFNNTVDFVVRSENPEIVAQLFKDHGCNNVQVFESGTVAFEEALKDTDDILVITGSLYLISDMYGLVSSLSSKL